MQRLLTILILTSLVLSVSLTAAAQDDPRLAQAVEHFGKGEFEKAAELLEAVEKEQPSNLLRLNAMAAWYKADRCDEAMAARGRVDMTLQLDPQAIEDLDRVNAYCKLKSARAFQQSRDWDKALGLLAGLETRDEKLAKEIASLRQEIELEKQRESEQAEVEEPNGDNVPIEPPPEPEPADRPSWALYTGLGLLGGGAALGVATLVKWRAIDQPNTNEGWRRFEDDWGCIDDACDAVIGEDEPDRAVLEKFRDNIRIAETASVAMGVTAGLAAAAGGGLLLYYGLSGKRSSAAVAPMVGPDANGFVFSLQF